MKLALGLFLVTLVTTSCGHMKKDKNEKEKYSPEVSFENNDKTYEAKVQLPKNMKDKVPLVVIVHEWWGRTPYVQMRSDMLNQEGYATLVVDMFGDSTVAANAKEAQELATPFYKNRRKELSF